MHRLLARAVAPLALLPVWMAVSLGTSASASPAPRANGEVVVRNAWIRWLPAGLPSAGYMTLVNRGSVPVTLTGVSSAEYGEIGMHQTVAAGGMSSMTPLRELTLPPHGTVRFAEGGYHLMMMQPRQPLHPGDTVPVTLHFAPDRTLTVSFKVRAGDGGE